ncbi:MAG: hypothetical protein IPK39_23795 [Sulfuritalea sp.]|nr:hypothetical protein [Sulfuritalea sp.]
MRIWGGERQGHIGTAWASTLSRNLSGSAFGVSTSTWHAQQLPQLVPDGSDIEQCRIRRGVDQDVEVAALGVIAVNDRAADTRVARMMRLNNATDGCATTSKGDGRFQVDFFTACQPVSLR